MKTKLFAALVLLAGVNVLQAMESKEVSAQLQTEHLLQEFAVEYDKLRSEYPQGERAFVGPLGDWSKKVDNLSNAYSQKIKALNPKAAESITKLNSPWRAQATPRSDEMSSLRL